MQEVRKSAMTSIVIPPDHILLSASFLRRIASLLASLDIPRRSIPDWIADTLYEYRGKVTHSSGDRFDIRSVDVDEAFGNEGSFRWVSDFLKLKDQSWKQSPQKRVLARIRLIVLCLILSGLLESWGEPERAPDESGPNSFGKYRQRAARTLVGVSRVDAMRVLSGILEGDASGKFWSRVTMLIASRNVRDGSVSPTNLHEMDFSVLNPKKGSGHEVSNRLLGIRIGGGIKPATKARGRKRSSSRAVSKASPLRPPRHR